MSARGGAGALARGVLWAALALAGLGASGAAVAQTAASPYTSATRYDLMGRVVGTLAPDPDGAAPYTYLAARTTYDAAGRAILTETGYLTAWQAESVAPSAWTGFVASKKIEVSYDGIDRKLTEWVKGWDTASGTWVSVALTQYSYDGVGRPECTATRMNPALYAALPASACTPGSEGSQGPDRIRRNVYDAAGQLLQVREGVGSAVESAEATYTYTANGKRAQVIDGEGNRAELRYDGHDRQVRWVFPSETRPAAFSDATPASAGASAGALNEADYEEYGYDAGGNRTSLRKRDGATFTLTYDALNRQTRKSLTLNPSNVAAPHRRDVYYGYDARGLQTYARFDSATGEGLATQYDAFGRVVWSRQLLDGGSRTVASCYDRDGNRTRSSFAESALGTADAAGSYCGSAWTQFTAYAYDHLDRPSAIQRDGNAAVAAYTYLPSGERSGFGGAFTTTYGYDPGGRLSALTNALPAAGASSAWTFAYNPASQLVQTTRSNDAFAWTGHYNVDRTYTANGLNQYTAAGTAAFCYDKNGNLTADGTSVYRYDAENRLVERRLQGGGNTDCLALRYDGLELARLRYDPAGRLYEVAAGSGATRFLNDGDALVAEYMYTGPAVPDTLLRRYVHGTDGKSDDPIAWYEGTGFDAASERLMRPDWQGSIVAVADSPGTTLLAINRYDEYGVPQGTNQGRFQYTGQAWIGELGMYYYKARIYSPTLGRFLQTDPIGYDDQVNLYAYVGGDPVNKMDPTGLSCSGGDTGTIIRFSCRVDDEKSLKDAGFTNAQINSVNRAYTAAVSSLMNNPGKNVEINLDGKSFTTKAGYVAGNLIKSFVRFNAGASEGIRLAGGPMTPEANPKARDPAGQFSWTSNRLNLPFVLEFGKNFVNQDFAKMVVDFIHEGFHGESGEAAFIGVCANFNTCHQREYNQEARRIFDGR